MRARNLLGYLAALAVAPLVFWVHCMVLMWDQRPDDLESAAWVLAFFYLYGIPIAAGAIVLFGWPAVRVLERRRRLTPWSCAAAGALAGVLAMISAGLLLQLYAFGHVEARWSLRGFFSPRALGGVLIPGITGAHAALVYWVVSGRHARTGRGESAESPASMP